MQKGSKSLHLGKIKLKYVLILFSIIFVVIILYGTDIIENNKYRIQNTEKCLGIPIISEEQFQEIVKIEKKLENIVCFEGSIAAYDQETQRIYIPCVVDAETQRYELRGKLKSDYPNYGLFFIDELAFENMDKAIKENHEFVLAAIDLSGNYMIYNLIFTTLPIVEIHGRYKDTDERGREIFSGEINVWEYSNTAERTILVQNSRLEWKIRGNTAMGFPKKSYKLSIKNSKGESENISFLGLERDDDYILNPMWMDDLKVREKMAITLWNQIAEQKNSTLKMSDAEYCEVIINDSYKGIYMLQERLEKKTLKLSDEDILFKGSGLDATEESTPKDIFEIVYTTEDENTTYAKIEEFLYKGNFSDVNKKNWVDNQLFMQVGHMLDNRRYKNMYYVIDRSAGKNSIHMIPWDTDMSFGVAWNNGFAYKQDSVETVSNRVEYDAIVAQYPELENMLSERWWELREKIFSLENILGIVNSNYEILDSSGVLARDYQVFNQNAWGGKDTRENLETYIIRRLEILDEKYGYTN